MANKIFIHKDGWILIPFFYILYPTRNSKRSYTSRDELLLYFCCVSTFFLSNFSFATWKLINYIHSSSSTVKFCFKTVVKNTMRNMKNWGGDWKELSREHPVLYKFAIFAIMLDNPDWIKAKTNLTTDGKCCALP